MHFDVNKLMSLLWKYFEYCFFSKLRQNDTKKITSKKTQMNNKCKMTTMTISAERFKTFSERIENTVKLKQLQQIMIL